MSTYDLRITKIEPNPDYDEMKAREQQDRIYGITAALAPQKEIEVRELRCSITEEEFQAIKQALIEVWK